MYSCMHMNSGKHWEEGWWLADYSFGRSWEGGGAGERFGRRDEKRERETPPLDIQRMAHRLKVPPLYEKCRKTS